MRHPGGSPAGVRQLGNCCAPAELRNGRTTSRGRLALPRGQPARGGQLQMGDRRNRRDAYAARPA
eukprot:3882225-Lingulodinium_polyedra.AAC.1